MAKRKWGKIIGYTAGGLVSAAVLGFAGLLHLANEKIAEDTASVSKAMNELAAKPVMLIKMPDECVNTFGLNFCDELLHRATLNAGIAQLSDGVYRLGDFDADMTKTFALCSRNHGGGNCQTDRFGDVQLLVTPDVIIPADTLDVKKAQFVWMVPGYKANTPAIATDGKKYFLTLQ